MNTRMGAGSRPLATLPRGFTQGLAPQTFRRVTALPGERDADTEDQTPEGCGAALPQAACLLAQCVHSESASTLPPPPAPSVTRGKPSTPRVPAAAVASHAPRSTATPSPLRSPEEPKTELHRDPVTAPGAPWLPCPDQHRESLGEGTGWVQPLAGTRPLLTLHFHRETADGCIALQDLTALSEPLVHFGRAAGWETARPASFRQGHGDPELPSQQGTDRTQVGERTIAQR